MSFLLEPLSVTTSLTVWSSGRGRVKDVTTFKYRLTVNGVTGHGRAVFRNEQVSNVLLSDCCDKSSHPRRSDEQSDTVRHCVAGDPWVWGGRERAYMGDGVEQTSVWSDALRGLQLVSEYEQILLEAELEESFNQLKVRVQSPFSFPPTVEDDLWRQDETTYNADGTVRHFSRGTQKIGSIRGRIYLSMERVGDTVKVEPCLDQTCCFSYPFRIYSPSKPTLDFVCSTCYEKIVWGGRTVVNLGPWEKSRIPLTKQGLRVFGLDNQKMVAAARAFQIKAEQAAGSLVSRPELFVPFGRNP